MAKVKDIYAKCLESMTESEDLSNSVIDEVELNPSELGDMQELLSADLSLESITLFLDGSLKNGNLSFESAMLLNQAVDEACSNIALSNDGLTISREAIANKTYSYDSAKKGIIDKLREISGIIKTKIHTHIETIAKQCIHFNGQIYHIENNIAHLERKYKNIEHKELRLNYIKPNLSCEALCTSNGFDNGLVNTHNTLISFINSYVKMAVQANIKYKNWLFSHKNQFEDEKLFNSLTLNKSDFLLSGMRKSNTAMFKSNELPGFKALYVSMEDKNSTGILAINQLRNIGYKINTYNKTTYDKDRTTLLSIIKSSANVWVTSMVELPSVKIHNIEKAEADQIIADHKSETKIAIPKKFIFHTLTKPEILKNIELLKTGVYTLKQLNKQLLEGQYAEKDFNTLVDMILQTSEESNQNTALMKNYVYALLSLKYQLATAILPYLINEYNAIIGYINKSINQHW